MIKYILLTIAFFSFAANADDVGWPKDKYIEAMRKNMPNTFCRADFYFRQCFRVSEDECKKQALKATDDCLVTIAPTMPATIYLHRKGGYGEDLGGCAGGKFEALLKDKKVDTVECSSANSAKWNQQLNPTVSTATIIKISVIVGLLGLALWPVILSSRKKLSLGLVVRQLRLSTAAIIAIAVCIVALSAAVAIFISWENKEDAFFIGYCKKGVSQTLEFLDSKTTENESIVNKSCSLGADLYRPKNRRTQETQDKIDKNNALKVAVERYETADDDDKSFDACEFGIDLANRAISVKKTKLNVATVLTKCARGASELQIKNKFFKRLCSDGDAIGCFNLGVAEADIGQKQESMRLYKIACDGKYYSACVNLGLAMSGAGDKVEAMRLYSLACEGKEMLGCNNVGSLEEVTKNMTQAKKYYTIACDGGSMLGCANLASLYKKDGDGIKALQLFKKSCDGGEPRGCVNLGLDEENKGHLAEATRLYKIACDGGNMMGCNDLGGMAIKSGNNIEAIRLYKMACDGGEQLACKNHDRCAKETK